MIRKRIYAAIAGSFVLTFGCLATAAPMEGVDSESQSPRLERAEKAGESRSSSSSTGLTIVALVIGLGGCAIGGFSFIQLRKHEEKFRKFQENAKRDMKILKSEIDDLAQQNTSLTKSLREVRTSLIAPVGVSKKTSAETAKTAVKSPTQGTSKSQQQVLRPVVQEKPRPIKPIYMSFPANGVFTGGATTYSPGRSLYVIEDNGGNSAKFRFIDDTTAATIAARSLSTFLESGCIIRGDSDISFSKVKTLSDGEVIKTPVGWRIERRAEVELI